jgi:ComF family protein
MVAIYKDQNERRLSAILAAFMVEAIPADWIIWADAICYVPCDKRALRRRGFDHMAHVAFEISRLTGLPIADFLLKSPISDQRGLGRKERQANLNGAFGVYVPSGHIAKDARNILLIDDVFTTGATLNAAAGALLEAGASEVRVATVTRVY